MLSMLLLLAVAPQAADPLTPYAGVVINGETVRQGLPPAREFRSGVIGMTPAHCRNDLTLTVDPTAPGNGLMWREGGEAVGLYRLLDRRVDGCPDPIVVNYRVPGSNAVGREAGRAPAPSPVIVRRP